MKVLIPVVLILCIFSVTDLSRCAEIDNVDDFHLSLTSINREVAHTPHAELEKWEVKYLELLKKKAKSPVQRGRIYFQIAKMYGRAISLYANKIEEYCNKALDFPLSLLDQIYIYSDLGQARQFLHNSCVNESKEYIRQQAIVSFLHGLNVIASNIKIDKRQDPIAIPVLNYDGPLMDEDIKRIKEVDALVAKREEVMLQNELLAYQEVFLEGIRALYPDKDYSLDQLRSIASEIIVDSRKMEKYFEP